MLPTVRTVADLLLAASGDEQVKDWRMQLQVDIAGAPTDGFCDRPDVYVAASGDLLIVPTHEMVERFLGERTPVKGWMDDLHEPSVDDLAFDPEEWQDLRGALLAARGSNPNGRILIFDITTGATRVVEATFYRFDGDIGFINVVLPPDMLMRILGYIRRWM